MRVFLIAISILLVIFTAGCAQVHYTVNPDQPPKMSTKEARNALKLTLSRAERPSRYLAILLNGDDLQYFRTAGSGVGGEILYKSIYNIDPEVIKIGSYFSVEHRVEPQNDAIIQIPGIVWSSEEDAKLFVDALHTLQMLKRNKKLDELEEDRTLKDITPRQAILGQGAQKKESPVPIKQDVSKAQITRHETEKKQKVVIRGEKIKVGIIEFQPLNEEARKESLGAIFSEMLTTALVNSEAFKVTEREQLQKVAKELQLSQSGMIDTSQAKQLGKMVGADAIIIGSVTKIGPDLRLDTRIIDVQSGIILTAEKIIGKGDLHSISNMADAIVDNLVNKFYRDKKP